MVLLIGAALAVLSIGILAYPFLRVRLRPQGEDSVDGASGDVPSLESIYQEISTLRLEYQLGKIPEDVYQELLGTYRQQAAVALQQQAKAGESAILEKPSEEDIREDGGGNAL